MVKQRIATIGWAALARNLGNHSVACARGQRFRAYALLRCGIVFPIAKKDRTNGDQSSDSVGRIIVALTLLASRRELGLVNLLGSLFFLLSLYL